MKKNLSIFMTAGSWLQRALALFLCVAALEAVQAAPQDTKRTITGTVVDQNNLPVVGATVMISNSANGTATDSNGQFTLSGVTDNDELQISFLGYKTVTMQVGTRTAIAATLEEDSGYLDEVVVVGYGTTTRRHIISAVSTVKSEAIENRPVANIQQALQGAAANLIIQTKNFNPTDNQMNISIRGVNTMGNNTPLVVIDGVPQPDAGRMNDLNPNDIESINILKDAGSAAIYGARSSNGVILITTKNGRKEMAPQIRFSAKVGIENPDILYKAVPTYRNAILRNEALSNVGREPLFTAAEIQDFAHFLSLRLHKVIFIPLFFPCDVNPLRFFIYKGTLFFSVRFPGLLFHNAIIRNFIGNIIHWRNTSSMYQQRTSHPFRIIRDVIQPGSEAVQAVRKALY